MDVLTSFFRNVSWAASLVIVASITVGCSLIYRIDDECSVDSDCTSRGRGLVCRSGLCVEGGADADADGDSDGDGDGDADGDADGDTDSDADADGDADGDADADQDADEEVEPVMPVELLGATCTRVEGIPLDEPVPDDAILIGAMHPFSGDLAIAGPYFDHATVMAMEELNRTGGLLGRPFVLITCDTGTDGPTAVAAAQHLADIGVSAVLGPFSSEITIAVYSEVFRDAGIAIVSAGANSPIMSSISFDGLIWSTSLPAARQATAIAEHLLNSDYERVAIVNRDDTWGTGMREAFQEVYCASRDCLDETTYVSRVYEVDDLMTSLTDVALGLVAYDPDVTLMLTYIEDALTFLGIAAALPDMPLRSFIWNDTLGNDIIFDLLIGATGTDASLPILCQTMGTTAALPRGPVYDSWLLRYRARWSENPVPFTANAYDGVYLLAYAIAAATAHNDHPTGFEIGAAMDRLSSGPVIEAGTTDWNEGILTLRASDTATIDYVGVAGDVDFVEGTGSVIAAVEGYRLNVERREVESVGIFYSIDGEYTPPDYSGVTDGACPFGVAP